MRFGPRSQEPDNDDDDTQAQIDDLFMKQYGSVSARRVANNLDGSGRSTRSSSAFHDMFDAENQEFRPLSPLGERSDNGSLYSRKSSRRAIPLLVT